MVLLYFAIPSILGQLSCGAITRGGALIREGCLIQNKKRKGAFNRQETFN